MFTLNLSVIIFLPVQLNAAYCEINDLSLQHKPLTFPGTSLIVSSLISPTFQRVSVLALVAVLIISITIQIIIIQYYKGRAVDVQTDNVEVSVSNK